MFNCVGHHGGKHIARLLPFPTRLPIKQSTLIKSTEYAQLIVYAARAASWYGVVAIGQATEKPSRGTIGIFSQMLHAIAMGRSGFKTGRFNHSSNFVPFTPQGRLKMRHLLVRVHISELSVIRHLACFPLTHCSVFLPDRLEDILVRSLCIS